MQPKENDPDVPPERQPGPVAPLQAWMIGLLGVVIVLLLLSLLVI